MEDVIKSIGFSQEEIIKDIINLHLDGESIECDPTYSKGIFYKNIEKPKFKFDLFPQTEDTIQADCRFLPLENGTLKSIMFDPPFVVGSGPSIENPKIGGNLTHKRFGSFKNIDELWTFYSDSLAEFTLKLKDGGKLIVKCQDTISGGKQYLSHVFLINRAANYGFYCKDLFILLAKSRMTSGKWKTQKHARKFHSYFLVFEKK